METTTLTFVLTMLAGLITFALALASCALESSRRVDAVRDCAVHIEHAIRREAEHKARTVRSMRGWRIADSQVEAFLTIVRAKAAQQGRPTGLYTTALNRMGV